MGTEVLMPQDFLLPERLRVSPASFHRSGNIIVSRKINKNRKPSPKPEKIRSNSVTRIKKPPSARRKDDVTNGGLVMGKVTLLRRGESLDSLTSKIKGGIHESDPYVCGSGRIGPDTPETVPKQIRLRAAVDDYAGSAFSLSPSPRSVPLPSFFKKLQVVDADKLFDDSATRDLRSLLRLD